MLLEYWDAGMAPTDVTTLAVERRIQLALKPGVDFVGRVDRVGLRPSGMIEVVEYKTSRRTTTSRPRLPDLLQLAAYGVALLVEQRVDKVLARRVVVPSGVEERFVVSKEDCRWIRLALLRWVRRLSQFDVNVANVGSHCRSCEVVRDCPRVPDNFLSKAVKEEKQAVRGHPSKGLHSANGP